VCGRPHADDVVAGDCLFQLGDNGSMLYAVGSGHFHGSMDHGDTWKPNDMGIPPGLIARSLDRSTMGGL
jgi:hypothetical protein